MLLHGFPCRRLASVLFVVLRQLFETLWLFGTVLHIGVYELTYTMVSDLVGIWMTTDSCFVRADNFFFPLSWRPMPDRLHDV